jgi:hypothetical protein
MKTKQTVEFVDIRADIQRFVDAMESLLKTKRESGSSFAYPPIEVMCGMQMLMLDKGELFHGAKPWNKAKPKVYGVRMPMAVAKGCFMNATKAAEFFWMLGIDAVYYEGYVMSNCVPTTIHHAWIVIDGVAYDSTLKNASTFSYCGVPVAKEILYENMMTTGMYGMFDAGRGIDRQALKAVRDSLTTTTTQE